MQIKYKRAIIKYRKTIQKNSIKLIRKSFNRNYICIKLNFFKLYLLILNKNIIILTRD